jgi:hypothetical protein
VPLRSGVEVGAIDGVTATSDAGPLGLGVLEPDTPLDGGEATADEGAPGLDGAPEPGTPLVGGDATSDDGNPGRSETSRR